nr:hypothetical protein [Paenibacillus xylanexedens]
MSEPQTPNLGLNKIDRSSPSTTYFDLDKYLDQNWEKIDGFTEQVEEKVEETATKVSGIQERLDSAERSSITLRPGIHVVNASQDAAFKFAGLQGRTVLNYQNQIGIYGVLNPYVIRYGENLLPPFYEWTLPTSAVINDSYNLTYPYVSGVTAYITYDLPVIPGQAYTLTINNSVANVRNIMNFYDSSGTKIETNPSIGTEKPTTAGNNTVTYQAPTGAKTMRMYLYGDPSMSGTASFSNPMLNIGTTPKSFEPREDSMLALQTELHANPDTGAAPDVVFEKDGQYYKLAKWRKVILDEIKPWEYDTNFNGFKTVRVTNLASDRLSNGRPIVTKFNGQTLTVGGASTAADIISVSWWQTTIQTQALVISVSNTDSGWGDSYIPTSDEIKAYFLGWTMSINGQPRYLPYNGSGTKVWIKTTMVNNLSTPMVAGSDYTTTLPTIIAGQDSAGLSYSPYQLLYQLATPVVEPITSEGQLTFNAGDNQMEVGTGIVLRERANPQVSQYGTYINSAFAGFEQTKLKYRTSKILTLFKDGKLDPSWVRNTLDAYGIERAVLSAYDPSTAYSVTYLMLDKYPTVDVTGTYAENEKALLLDTVRTLQENTTRISVLESKKAEKDSTAWITPTLLNGWTLSSNGVFPAQYYKDSLSIVHVNGIVTGGTTDTVVFKLPVGYRPKTTHRISTLIMSGTTVLIAYLDVKASGDVAAVFPTQSTHLPLSLSFPAEQ